MSFVQPMPVALTSSPHPTPHHPSQFKVYDFDTFSPKKYLTGKNYKTDPPYYHHKSLPIPLLPTTPFMTLPKKSLHTRTSCAVKHLITTAFDPALSSAVIPHQRVDLHGSLYVSIDGIAQHVHSTKVGGATRRDVVTRLEDKRYLGEEWVKWVLRNDDVAGVGGIVERPQTKPSNTTTTTTTNTTTNATTKRLYLKTLFSLPSSPPPTSNYMMDPHCEYLLAQNKDDKERR